MLLQGLFIPLTCTFDREGRSFLRKLESNVRRYSLAPIAGMVALPPGGEGLSLTEAEVSDTLRAVAAAAGKEKVLLAGIEVASVHAALARTEAAAEAGFDAIVLAAPTNWPRLFREEDAREVKLFFQCVADASPLPLVLWSSAEAPSLHLPTGVIAGLSEHPNIIGVADAQLTPERLQEVLAGTASVRREVEVTSIFEAVTRRMSGSVAEAALPTLTLVTIAGQLSSASAGSTQPALKRRKKVVGFQVLSAGPAHSMLSLLEAGLSGVLPTLAACAPQGCFEAYAAWKDGDPALSAERGARLQAADELLAAMGPAALKYACDWNAYFGGAPRLPRVSLTAAARTQVERALGDVRN